MRPPRILFALIFVPLLAGARPRPATAGSFHHLADAGPRTCAGVDMHFDGKPVAHGEQVLHIARATEPLILGSVHDGGITIEGWDREEYEVTVCKIAADGRSYDARPADAKTRLAEIEARLEGRELVTTGPSGDDWAVFLIVRAPRGAAIEAAIHDAPFSARRAQGDFRIHGANGPVTLEEVQGTVEVDLENGPVSLDGGSGDVRIATRNGPISVRLSGSGWSGKGLEAHAENGPLRLEIADGYDGVVVESSGNAPWRCDRSCDRGRRDWGRHGRSIAFGGPTRVRLATVNGPVTIGD